MMPFPGYRSKAKHAWAYAPLRVRCGSKLTSNLIKIQLGQVSTDVYIFEVIFGKENSC